MIKLIRHKNNPVLGPNPKNKWESKAVFNPAVISRDGKVFMLYRAIGEYEDYISRIGLAVSEDGFNFKRIRKKPIIKPSVKYDRWACEDPRMTEIEGRIYITYAALSEKLKEGGKPTQESMRLITTSTALISTEDFRTFKKHGIITPINSDNRDVIFFPEKINGKYVMLHRPARWSKEVKMPCSQKYLPEKPSIWISYSYDLKKWFGHKVLMEPSHKKDGKIGGGAPPLKTKNGWLLIYHHVQLTKNGVKYTAKAALLDLKNPEKIISKIPYPILEPKKKYEKGGDENNVVFPTGNFIKNGKLFVYYGAADKYCCAASISLDKLIKELLRYRKK